MEDNYLTVTLWAGTSDEIRVDVPRCEITGRERCHLPAGHYDKHTHRGTGVTTTWWTNLVEQGRG